MRIVRRQPSHASFLRWVGGKQRLVSTLATFLPPDLAVRRYVEPFLGAGSLYFAVLPKEALLADANPDLIHTYSAIRENPGAVGRALRPLARANSRHNYYVVRDRYNKTKPSASRAAAFIYLNRVCFNGVFRVNRRGQFNVPFGDKPDPWFPDSLDLRRISASLIAATLLCSDYRETLALARRGDFIYLDPPYPPLNGTSYFDHYTADRFPIDQQEELAEDVARLNSKGCKVMVSNADIPLIRKLYKGFSVSRLEVTRHVTCKAVKHSVGELVITNY